MPYANVNLEGRLVNSPEFRTGKNNRRFVTFRLAVNQRFGEQENASFYDCTGKEEIAARIEKAGLTKGRMIHLSGNQTIREYTDRENNRRISVDVGILDWHFVGSRPRDTDGSGSASEATEAGPAGTVNDEQYIEDEEDLPF